MKTWKIPDTVLRGASSLTIGGSVGGSLGLLAFFMLPAAKRAGFTPETAVTAGGALGTSVHHLVAPIFRFLAFYLKIGEVRLAERRSWISRTRAHEYRERLFEEHLREPQPPADPADVSPDSHANKHHQSTALRRPAADGARKLAATAGGNGARTGHKARDGPKAAAPHSSLQKRVGSTPGTPAAVRRKKRSPARPAGIGRGGPLTGPRTRISSVEPEVVGGRGLTGPAALRIAPTKARRRRRPR
jgi:hypothetical protein